MPPKKKGKGKKKPPMLIDGVDTSEMTRDQLEEFALKLKAEMDREREERNYFQLERDKIRTFWEICRQELDEAKTELRQKDHEVELAQELSDMESKHIVQRMKYLQYENHTKIREARAEAMVQLKLAQEQHVLQEIELMKDKRELQRFVREREAVFESQIQQIRIQHKEEMVQNRMKFERETKDINLLHDERMIQMKKDIELVHRMQMVEVEERKNVQIARLIASHETAFNDMKNYYNDITLNNLGLISSLKEQLEILRKQSERNERIATDTIIENRKLKEPLEAAQLELAQLRQKLEHFDRDRAQLGRTKTRNSFIEKQLKALTWETEALILRNDTLVKDREDLKNSFHDVINELQQKTGLRNVLLERKVSMLEVEKEKRDIILQETLERCKDALEEPNKSNAHIEAALSEKNDIIAKLQYEIARVCKAHDDLLATYESKLAQYGIPEEELGFEPIRFTTKTKYLCGPAGLVTINK